jgi:hypothetical protein
VIHPNPIIMLPANTDVPKESKGVVLDMDRCCCNRLSRKDGIPSWITEWRGDVSDENARIPVCTSTVMD